MLRVGFRRLVEDCRLQAIQMARDHLDSKQLEWPTRSCWMSIVERGAFLSRSDGACEHRPANTAPARGGLRPHEHRRGERSANHEDHVQLLAVALGSASELRYLLKLSKRLRILEVGDHRDLDNRCGAEKSPHLGR